MDEDEAAALLALQEIRKVSDGNASTIYQELNDVVDLVEKPSQFTEKQLSDIGLRNRDSLSPEELKSDDVQETYREMRQKMDRLKENEQPISRDHPLYPDRLKENTGPAVLFVKGDVDLLDKEMVGFGGRNGISQECKEWVRETSRKISENKTVVTGLREGVEAEAVRGALETKNPPVVVRRTGFGNPTSDTEKNLPKQEIVDKGGLVVSRVPPEGQRGEEVDLGEMSGFPVYDGNDDISYLASEYVVIPDEKQQEVSSHTHLSALRAGDTVLKPTDMSFEQTSYFIEETEGVEVDGFDDMPSGVRGLETNILTSEVGEENWLEPPSFETDDMEEIKEMYRRSLEMRTAADPEFRKALSNREIDTTDLDNEVNEVLQTHIEEIDKKEYGEEVDVDGEKFEEGETDVAKESSENQDSDGIDEQVLSEIGDRLVEKSGGEEESVEWINDGPSVWEKEFFRQHGIDPGSIVVEEQPTDKYDGVNIRKIDPDKEISSDKLDEMFPESTVFNSPKNFQYKAEFNGLNERLYFDRVAEYAMESKEISSVEKTPPNLDKAKMDDMSGSDLKNYFSKFFDDGEVESLMQLDKKEPIAIPGKMAVFRNNEEYDKPAKVPTPEPVSEWIEGGRSFLPLSTYLDEFEKQGADLEDSFLQQLSRDIADETPLVNPEADLLVKNMSDGEIEVQPLDSDVEKNIWRQVQHNEGISRVEGTSNRYPPAHKVSPHEKTDYTRNIGGNTDLEWRDFAFSKELVFIDMSYENFDVVSDLKGGFDIAKEMNKLRDTGETEEPSLSDEKAEEEEATSSRDEGPSIMLG